MLLKGLVLNSVFSSLKHSSGIPSWPFPSSWEMAITLFSLVHQGGESNPAQISFNLVLPSNALGCGDRIQPAREQVPAFTSRVGTSIPQPLPSPCMWGGWCQALKQPSESVGFWLEMSFWKGKKDLAVLRWSCQVAGTCVAEFIGLEKSGCSGQEWGRGWGLVSSSLLIERAS